MLSQKLFFLAGALLVLIVGKSASAQDKSAPSVVKLIKTEAGYSLTKNGKPFFIQGVGGNLHLETLKSCGGNAIRTWGGDDQTEMLDACHKLGLSVCVGIWLGQPRQGFRYDDAAAVERQKQNSLAFVRKTKNHPAVLMWGLGNEMEGDGNDPKIWKAIDDLAKAVKLEDPNHPTMTVIAEIGGKAEKAVNFAKNCPNVDLLGVNAYAGLASVPERMKAAGFNRPFVVTEFGPAGYWEVGSTSWKAQVEPLSSQKADSYLKNYRRSIAGEKGRCLGSFAFFWGQKQEATATWFGMFLNSGERTEAIETMQYLWTGKYPEVRCPRIVQFESSLKEKRVLPNSMNTAEITLANPNQAGMIVRWEVRQESIDRKSGGDSENQPPSVSDCFVKTEGTKLTIKAPPGEGAYRLFVYAYDGKGNASVANIPFLVKK